MVCTSDSLEFYDPKVFGDPKVISNGILDFNDQRLFHDFKVFDDPKVISNTVVDFDDSKVFNDPRVISMGFSDSKVEGDLRWSYLNVKKSSFE